MRLIVLSFFGILILGLYSSCQTKRGCDTSESLVILGFYKTDSVTPVSIDTVSVYGVGREDSLLYELQSLTSVLLPLSPANESSAFVFEIGSLKDTITFFYQTNIRYESEECGFMADFRIENVLFTENMIDSIQRKNDEILNENEENIKIFFK